jgi:hypothetical protein
MRKAIAHIAGLPTLAYCTCAEVLVDSAKSDAGNTQKPAYTYVAGWADSACRHADQDIKQVEESQGHAANHPYYQQIVQSFLNRSPVLPKKGL